MVTEMEDICKLSKNERRQTLECTNYNSLRSMAKELGLGGTGKKAEIIERLLSHADSIDNVAATTDANDSCEERGTCETSSSSEQWKDFPSQLTSEQAAESENQCFEIKESEIHLDSQCLTASATGEAVHEIDSTKQKTPEKCLTAATTSDAASASPWFREIDCSPEVIQDDFDTTPPRQRAFECQGDGTAMDIEDSHVSSVTSMTEEHNDSSCENQNAAFIDIPADVQGLRRLFQSLQVS